MVGPTGNRPVQRRKSGTCGRPAGLEKTQDNRGEFVQGCEFAPPFPYFVFCRAAAGTRPAPAGKRRPAAQGLPPSAARTLVSRPSPSRRLRGAQSPPRLEGVAERSEVGGIQMQKRKTYPPVTLALLGRQPPLGKGAIGGQAQGPPLHRKRAFSQTAALKPQRSNRSAQTAALKPQLSNRSSQNRSSQNSKLFFACFSNRSVISWRSLSAPSIARGRSDN